MPGDKYLNFIGEQKYEQYIMSVTTWPYWWDL